jgi:hypothetical protein
VVVTEAGGPDETALAHWCATRLPEYGVPRRFRLLTAIPATETLKSNV